MATIRPRPTLKDSILAYGRLTGHLGWVMFTCWVLGDIATFGLFIWDISHAPLPEGIAGKTIWLLLFGLANALFFIPFIAFHKIRLEHYKELVTLDAQIEEHKQAWTALNQRIERLNSQDLQIEFRDNSAEFISSTGFFVFHVVNRSPLRSINDVRVRLTSIEVLGNFGHGITSTPLVVGEKAERELIPQSAMFNEGGTFALNSGDREIFNFVVIDGQNRQIRVLDARLSASFNLNSASSYRLTIRATGRDTKPAEQRFVVGINSQSGRLICEIDKSGYPWRPAD